MHARTTNVVASSSHVTLLRQVAAVAAGYFIFARLGLLLPYVGTHVTLIWLPTGIAVAALWRWGDRVLPGVVIGVILTYFSRPMSHPATLVFVIGNTLAPWVTVQLLHRAGFHAELSRRRDVPVLVAAAIVGMLISSGIGATALSMAGMVKGTQLLHAWVRWWAGDVVGVLLAGPPLLLLNRRNLSLAGSALTRSEWLGCMVLIVASSAAVFLSSGAMPEVTVWLHGPMVFVPFLPLTWLAARANRPFYPSLAVLCIAAIGVLGSARGLGPIGAVGDAHAALPLLWGYVVSLALIVLLLGALSAEAAQATAQLQGLFESSRDAIIIGRPGGLNDAANPAAQHLFGMSAGEICKLGRDGLFDLQDGRLSLALAQRDVSGSVLTNVRALHADGHAVEIEAMSSVYTGHDGVQRTYAVMRDITDRLRTERELQYHRDHLETQVQARTDELARANHALMQARDDAQHASLAKTRFLANMSHEIRTPLNAILGMTHLLRRDVTDERHQAQLAKVANAGDHLLSVINDILDLTKIEAGRFELDKVSFSLQAVLTTCRAQAGALARAKGLFLTVETISVPDGLVGDPTRLSQALVNLLGNAIKFTAHGAVKLLVEHGGVLDGQAVLRFSVTDTGPGIAPAVLERLFTVFEQGDASITRQHGGTGLGLAITRHLALLMGGDIGVNSVQGQGSEFWFTARFNLAPAEVAQTPVDPDLLERAVRERHAGARVLLAEDNPVNREVALGLLQEVGLAVTVAVDGAEAVDLARQADYDLILMDMQMPVLDGLAAARALRASSRHARTAIIAMTANAYEDDRQRCLMAGMDDHIAKPVEPARLHATLLLWLDATENARARSQRPA